MASTFRLSKPSLLIIVLSCILVACGGGGGGSSELDGGNTTPDDGSSESGDGNTTPDDGSTSPKPAGLLSVSLSWTIPGTRENGEALDLSDIKGYEILYRKVNDELFTVISIADPATSEYKITDLEAGTYEFKITVYDTEGAFSSFSNAQVVDLSG